MRITRRVAWSNYVTVITVIMCVGFACIVFIANMPHHLSILIFAGIGIVILSAFYYSPMAISVDCHNLIIRRMLTPKYIAINDIAEVRLFQTTMDIRITGSGGFFGYFGWFRNREIGKYFAYIGKWNDTFLIKMKSGRKYIISCNQPEVIVKSIMDSISSLNAEK